MSKKNQKSNKLEQKDLLPGKEIQVELLTESDAIEIRKTWEKVFAKNLSRSEKDQIHFHEMFWHIFSYEKVDAVTGDKALAAFNKQKKEQCYLFYQEKTDVLKINRVADSKTPDILNRGAGMADVYIFSSDFSWTYVKTHETDFGPYFCKKQR